jgi:type I restriction enzyme, S subunit
VNELTFVEQFADQYAWAQAAAKRRFRFKKQANRGMIESHRLALTLGGVIDRAIDDDEGLQSSDYSTYQIFERDDLVFKLIDLENIRTSRVGYVPRRGIMSPAYIRLQKASKDTYSRYYYWLFYGAYVNNVFNGMGGGVRQNLTPTDLLEFPIPLPDLATQKEVADFLDRKTARIDQLIEKKARFIAVLNEKRIGVITDAVTRGVDPNVAMKNSGVDWIGSIPASWHLMKLGFLGSCANGINIAGDAFGSGFPFVSYSDVYKHRELPAEVDGLVQSTKADRCSYSVKAGDVLFTRTSETIEEVGFASVCFKTIPDAVFAGFLIRFRPADGVLEPEFSKFAFQNSGLRDFFAKEMKLVTRASLSQGLLQKMPILIPPKEEQVKIAGHLELMDRKCTALVAKTQRSIGLLKESRAALITAAVTGQIDVTTWGKDGKTDRRLDQIEEAMRA